MAKLAEAVIYALWAMLEPILRIGIPFVVVFSGLYLLAMVYESFGFSVVISIILVGTFVVLVVISIIKNRD